MAKDGNPWVWVLGESDEDASEDEKEKSKFHVTHVIHIAYDKY